MSTDILVTIAYRYPHDVCDIVTLAMIEFRELLQRSTNSG